MCLMTVAPKSYAGTSLNAPPNTPIGVRYASARTTRVMYYSSPYYLSFYSENGGRTTCQSHVIFPNL